MLIKTDRGYEHAVPSDITPQAVYEGRRTWLKGMAAGAAGTALAGWAARDAMAMTAGPGKLAKLPGARSAVDGAVVMDKLTPMSTSPTTTTTTNSAPTRRIRCARPTASSRSPGP